MTKLKIGFAVIGIHTVPMFFFQDFTMCLYKAMKDFDVSMVVVKGGYSDVIRNKAVKEILKSNPDRIVLMDADQNFTYDQLVELLAYDVDIVSALYVYKNEPFNPIAFTGNGVRLIDYPENKLIQIYCGGTGLTIIKPEVFKKIPEPWFNHAPNMSEDVYFAMKVKDAGIPWYLATEIQIGHNGIYPNTWELFKDKVMQTEGMDLIKYDNGVIGAAFDRK
jgi:hypothetical protein